jgi:hypothetical protein
MLVQEVAILALKYIKLPSVTWETIHVHKDRLGRVNSEHWTKIWHAGVVMGVVMGMVSVADQWSIASYTPEGARE